MTAAGAFKQPGLGNHENFCERFFWHMQVANDAMARLQKAAQLSTFFDIQIITTWDGKGSIELE